MATGNIYMNLQNILDFCFILLDDDSIKLTDLNENVDSKEEEFLNLINKLLIMILAALSTVTEQEDNEKTNLFVFYLKNLFNFLNRLILLDFRKRTEMVDLLMKIFFCKTKF